jgi:putative DNA primase/helicase
MELVLPRSLDSERYVLGALLMSSDAAAAVLARCTAEQFYATAHQAIFAAARTVHELRGFVDVITLGEYLEGRGALAGVGGLAALSALAGGVASLEHLEGHVARVADMAIRRATITALERGSTALADEEVSAGDVVARVAAAAGGAVPRAKPRARLQQNPTDDELGAAWLAAHRDTIFARDAWYRYGGGYWQRVDAAVEAEIWGVLRGAKGARVRPSKNKKTSVLDYARCARAAGDDPFDRAQHLICLRNGVYSTESHALHPHAPEHYFTSQLPIEYAASATCPRWLQALDEWFPDAADATNAAADYLAEAVGYSLTADMRHQMAWMLVGDGGNGKDKFLNVLRALAGDGHHALDLAMLARSPYGLAYIPGKRLITCTESPDHTVAAAYIKRMISGETVEARRLRGDNFNFKPICKIWWAVNDKPTVNDSSYGFWRRWTIVPFTATFDGVKCERDEDLDAKLIAELPGIFNWAMGGLARLRARGRFAPPPQFTAATEEYRRDQSSVALFAEDACVRDGSDTLAVLYAAYREYCRACGYDAKGRLQFGADLVRLGATRDRGTGGVRRYSGIRVRLEVDWQ